MLAASSWKNKNDDNFREDAIPRFWPLEVRDAHCQTNSSESGIRSAVAQPFLFLWSGPDRVKVNLNGSVTCHAMLLLDLSIGIMKES
ncbi:hypothetical protein COCNU_contig69647886G000010 [Cocos nucifera]|nr:hypothetical protein [Cocos nucifera]